MVATCPATAAAMVMLNRLLELIGAHAIRFLIFMIIAVSM